MRCFRYESLKSVLLLAVVFLLGYIAMRGLSYLFPFAADSWISFLVYGAILIPLALLIPYLMLKLWFHAEHVEHPDEEELRLEDLPKDEVKGRWDHEKVNRPS